MSTRRSRAEWRRVISRQSRSGLSISEFCRREGIRAQTLSWWRWKLRGAERGTPSVEAEAPRFLQLDVAGIQAADGGVGVEIVLPGEIVVRVPHGFDSAQLEALLRAVRASC